MLNTGIENKRGWRDYWQIFLRRKWLIIIPIVVSISMAVPLSYLMTPVYMATSMLQTDFGRISNLQGVSNMRGFGTLPSDDMNNIRYSIERRQFLKDVADRVNIAAYLRSIGRPTGTDSEVKYLRGLINLRSAGSGIIQISARHPKPDIAKNIADTIVSNYFDKTLRRRQDTANYSTSFIGSELVNYKKKLYDTELAIADANEKGVFDSISNEDQLIIQESAKLKSNLVEVEMDLQEAKGELQNTKTLSLSSENSLGTAPLNSPSPLFTNTNPEITDLEAKMAGLRTQYNQLSMKYTDQFPQMKSLKDEIIITQDKLNETKAKYNISQNDIKSRLSYWNDKIASLELKRTILTGKIDEYDKKLQGLPKRLMELTRLQREKAANEKIYSMLVSRLNESDLIKNTEYSGTQNLTEMPELAIEPDKPISPNRKKILFMAVIVGFALGFGPTFLLEYFDKSFRSVDDITNYLGVPALATIPKLTTQHTEIKKKSRKIIIFVFIAFFALLILILITDLVTANLLQRDSIFMGIYHDSISFIKSQINKI